MLKIDLLKRWGYGRIPQEMLVVIDTFGHSLWEPAALAFMRMQRDAAKENVIIKVLQAYLPLDSPLLTSTSGNGWGTVIDIDGGKFSTFQWMNYNAAIYGFTEKSVDHWVYDINWRTL